VVDFGLVVGFWGMWWWILGRVVDFRACGGFWGGLVDFRRVVDSRADGRF